MTGTHDTAENPVQGTEESPAQDTVEDTREGAGQGAGQGAGEGAVGDAPWVLQDAEVNRAIGTEIRAAREAAGLSRPALVALLPFPATVASLLNWELAHRAIAYAKLAEVGRALNRTAADLLRRALERVDAIQTLTVTLHLEQLSGDTSPALGPLRTWAVNKLAARTDAGPVVQVHYTVVREWAVLCDMPLAALVEHLTHAASLRQIPARNNPHGTEYGEHNTAHD